MNEEIKHEIVVLGFGPQDMSFIGKAGKLCGKTAELHQDEARMAGADFAIGTPKGIEILRKRLTAGAVAHELAAHANSGLSSNAIMWLATGHRGSSSNTLFTFLTGVDAEGDHGHRYPHDPSDLGRCRRLLDQCPELVSCLPRVAAAGPVWAAFVDRWDELCKLMDEEAPEWRNGQGKCEKLFKLMQEIIDSAFQAK